MYQCARALCRCPVFKPIAHVPPGSDPNELQDEDAIFFSKFCDCTPDRSDRAGRCTACAQAGLQPAQPGEVVPLPTYGEPRLGFAAPQYPAAQHSCRMLLLTAQPFRGQC